MASDVAAARLGGLSTDLFAPRSIAIVGASGRSGSVSARPLHLLRQHGFAGDVFPVNPRYDSIDGDPCFGSLREIGAPVDLVLSMVPADLTLEVVREAGEVGAKVVVVFASGFAETGSDGAAMQELLQREAEAAGVRVLGPNCQGVICPTSGLFATFTNAANRSVRGGSRVAYVGQSGAIGGSVLDLANERGLELDAWVATGNQCDLDIVEVSQALVDSSIVSTILVYAEGVSDGGRFVQLCESARRADKRLVLLRSGLSTVGKRAAASHTGAMLGDDAALVAVAREFGVILVDDVEELLTMGSLLAQSPGARGRKVGIVTTSGGAGILVADHCAKVGLSVPELSEAIQAELASLIPEFGAASNPIDVTAQIFNTATASEDFEQVCRVVGQSGEVDGVVIVLTMVTGERAASLAKVITVVAGTLDIPVWVIWLASPSQTVIARDVLLKERVPVFESATSFTTAIVRQVRAISDVTFPCSRPPRRDEVVGRALDGLLAGKSPSREFLEAIALKVPRSWVVASAADAVAAIDGVNSPLAVKIANSKVMHKSDIGGVLLGVAPEDVADAYRTVVGNVHRHGVEDNGRVEIQEMVEPGVELLFGATASGDGYPALISVGAGGIATELYRDVCSRIAPVSETEALDMLAELRLFPLLNGFRGQPKRDLLASARALSALSQEIAERAHQQVEVEINPVIVGVDGLIAVDVIATGDTDLSISDE